MMTLKDVLMTLSVDPYAQDAFARDPQAFLSTAGLTSDGQLALRQKRPGELDGLLDSGSWTRCAIGSDPGPDPLPDAHARPGRGELEVLLDSGSWTRCAIISDPGPDPLPDAHAAPASRG